MRRILAAAAVAAASLAPGAAAGYDRLVIFGDSLSDTGNAGRFSNGPVWVEGLGRALGLAVRPSSEGGSNYAIGGARLDPGSGPTSLPAQLGRYRGAAASGGRALYVLYGGGNDLIAAAVAPDGAARVDAAVAALEAMLADLAAAGATDVLVPNLPDIAMIPAARDGGSVVRERASRLTERFNAGLAAVLDRVERDHALRIHRLDVRAMAERARADPAAFGFADVTTPCLGLASCEGYLFWDGVHPTAEAHARLAESAAALLRAL
jgi:phospholipase/lecithinase/hemolysin